MSFRFVMPMTRMLLSSSTPSILLRIMFTTPSSVPVPPDVDPRCLQMASNSSKMIMCSSLSSPSSAYSFSAGSKRRRTFASDSPTNLSRISPAFTTCGSRVFSTWPIFRAISVFPHPGGP